MKESVVNARGEAQNPMTTEEVLIKLKQCMAVTLNPQYADAIIQLLQDFENMPSIANIMQAIYDASLMN